MFGSLLNRQERHQGFLPVPLSQIASVGVIKAERHCEIAPGFVRALPQDSGRDDRVRTAIISHAIERLPSRHSPEVRDRRSPTGVDLERSQIARAVPIGNRLADTAAFYGQDRIEVARRDAIGMGGRQKAGGRQWREHRSSMTVLDAFVKERVIRRIHIQIVELQIIPGIAIEARPGPRIILV